MTTVYLVLSSLINSSMVNVDMGSNADVGSSRSKTSGSIAIACHNLGFDLTACELDKDYFESAMKRINNHKSQIRLF